jgi:hypothetical protein
MLGPRRRTRIRGGYLEGFMERDVEERPSTRDDLWMLTCILLTLLVSSAGIWFALTQGLRSKNNEFRTAAPTSSPPVFNPEGFGGHWRPADGLVLDPHPPPAAAAAVEQPLPPGRGRGR